jgi:hypothetical protein
VPEATPEKQVEAALGKPADKPPPKPPAPEKRDYSGTNFGVFSRAVAKSTF